jgi:hypothetical protein
MFTPVSEALDFEEKLQKKVRALSRVAVGKFGLMRECPRESTPTSKLLFLLSRQSSRVLV